MSRPGVNLDWSLDKANFLVSRAITGHEALHVLYSDPETVIEAARESPMLKTILNILEDARIEKIGSEQSHVSKTLFGFVNGIAKNRLPEFADTAFSDKFSVINLLLRWRLGAAIPKLDPTAQALWRQVQTLATRALYSQECRQVLDLARGIVKIAGLDQQNPEDSNALENVEEVIDKMQSNMSGSRDSTPMTNPVRLEPKDSADNDDSDAEPPSPGSDPSGVTDDAEYGKSVSRSLQGQILRDTDKPFSAQKSHGLTTPEMALSLVIDRSGSMEDVIHELRTMSMAITMACDNQQIPLSIWALEYRFT